MAAGFLSKILSIVLPKTEQKGGLAFTPTFRPAAATSILPTPFYQDHLQDIFTTRTSEDSRALMQQLAKTDPDVSAAFNAYLTAANTKPIMLVKNLQGQIDSGGMKILQQTILALTQTFDYTNGFTYKPSLDAMCESMRYMLLMRGATAVELVFDQNLAPTTIRPIDTQFLFWWERTPGAYKPQLRQIGQIIELDIPSIFISFYHRDPTTIYPDSTFVSAINTIAARQQVINDLYRIMRITGYPRMDIQLLEEVVQKNAPAQIKQDAEKLRVWSNTRMNELAGAVSNLRPDQSFVHWDSVQVGMINEKAPGMELDITPVIETLNSQNQAALKVMATIIGRGESGVNTASVEARIFSMNADELNRPVGEILSNILTMALRVQGFEGYVDVKFTPAEMRPLTELEPHLVIKSSRLKQDLSLGLISDMEYSLAMYGRPPLPNAPKLQGTGFLESQTTSGTPDPGVGTGPSNGGDSVARSLTAPGGKAAKSNIVKKTK
jgi:hypothetical protein